MKAYWVIFSGPGFGCGVTAIDEADCRSLAEESPYFANRRIVSVVEIKNVDELDENHVVPNMGNIFMRGIWFPNGS